MNGHKAYILIDSGSTGNFVSKKFVKKIGLEKRGEKSSPGKVAMANGVTELIECLKNPIELKIKKYKKTIRPQVIDLAAYDLILGMEWLEHEKPSISWQDKRITIGNLILQAGEQKNEENTPRELPVSIKKEEKIGPITKKSKESGMIKERDLNLGGQ